MQFGYTFKPSLIIAIDFDGTIVEHCYPAVGRTRPLAFQTLKALQANGHRLILLSHRTGQKLEEAVKFVVHMGSSSMRSTKISLKKFGKKQTAVKYWLIFTSTIVI